jgi:hypothetical protein
MDSIVLYWVNIIRNYCRERRTWVERQIEWPWTNHPVGSTKNNIKEINGWYWRDVAILNETLNNGVTVYWGYGNRSMPQTIGFITYFTAWFAGFKTLHVSMCII